MSKTLTEVLPELRRPFTAAAIKMKPQATSGEGGAMKGLVTYYIDSRLVVERLNAVVGPEGWTDSYRLLCEGALAPGVGIPVECALTILGYTKVDVGQIAPGGPDDKAWKSAYSDAFKRAAVKFSVGAYLYGGAGVWAPVKVGRNGKAQGFTPEGARQARQSYATWIASKAMKDLYGEPLDHGDVLEEASGDDPKAEEPAAHQPPLAEPAAVPPADQEVEPASSPDDPVSFEQRATITQLVVKAAKANKSTAPKLTETLVGQYGPFESLSSAAADELIGKLTRWAANVEKAAA
jgi:hypothetical protein